jgi:hypothetical protein
MKHVLALLLLSGTLVAQDKPAAEAPNPAPYGFEKAAVTKPKIPPINVGDELIELIHQLKKDATVLITPPSDPDDFGGTNGKIRADIYTARINAKTEAQRLLLQALIELAKEAAKPTAVQVHSSSYKAP